MKSLQTFARSLTRRAREADVRKQVVDRASQANAVLTDETSRWLAGLPMKVRPLSLARKFPRIANSVADLWREWRTARNISTRSSWTCAVTAAGFRRTWRQELLALRSHYSELHPHKGSSWDLVAMDD